MRFSNHIGWIILTLLIVILGTSSMTQAQETITVTGEGTANAMPSGALVEIGLVRVSSDLVTTYQAINRSAENIVNALTDAGVAAGDIQLIDFDLESQDRLDARGIPSGEYVYRARTIYRVVIRDIADLEQALDLAISNGANIIHNLTFILTDAAALEQQARKLALANALTRATDLSNALQLVLDQPVLVEELGVTRSISPDAPPDNALLLVDAAGVIERVAITVRVAVTYRYRVRG